MAHPITIAIGDTSLATSRRLAEAFQAEGLRVVAVCHDGLALVEAAVAHQPSLLVLDLILPKLTGLQVIEALRRKGMDPTFVVASAISAQSRVVAAKEAGASFYILKPIEPSRLGQVASSMSKKLANEAR